MFHYCSCLNKNNVGGKCLKNQNETLEYNEETNSKLKGLL